ncbi:MAG: phosphatidylglycerophosphatase A [Pseudomonadota bacterium]
MSAGWRGLATLWGLGRIAPAPGTWGSAAALPLGFALHWAGGFPLFFIGLTAVTAAGWAAIRGVEAWEADASEVVVDEVAGQLLALAPLSLGLWIADAAPGVWPWPGWVGAFVMFRLFDIWKPGWVGQAEALPGAAGVMADDLVAGAFAAGAVTAAAAISHAWLI